MELSLLGFWKSRGEGSGVCFLDSTFKDPRKLQHSNFSRTYVSDIVVNTFLYDLVFCPHEKVTASSIDEVAETSNSRAISLYRNQERQDQKQKLFLESAPKLSVLFSS